MQSFGSCFVVLLLCCVRCECSGKKISEFPPDTVDEGNQTLIKYNDEGGGCRSQVTNRMLLCIR